MNPIPRQHQNTARNRLRAASAPRCYAIHRPLCVALVAVCHFAYTGAAAAQSANATRSACSQRAETMAKRHFARARKHLVLGENRAAIEQYQLAYRACPRTFIIYNAAGVHWLVGQKHAERGQMADALESKRKALHWYEKYIELEPWGELSDNAREQFFQLAEELYARGRLADAREIYERYVALAPEGARLARVAARLAVIARQLRPPGLVATGEHDAGRERGTQDQERAAAVPTAYRVGFWTSAAMAATALVFAGNSGLQVRRYEDEAKDALRDYEDASGDAISGDTCAGAARLLADNNSDFTSELQGLVRACDRGKTHATMMYVFSGVALLAAVTAGILHYRGRASRARVAVEPAVSGHSVGALMTLRF